MIFSCLAVFINTVAEWNVWWVEKKLELRQAVVWIWFVWALITTLCCIVFIISSVCEHLDRYMREECSTVVMDAVITFLHDVPRIIISIIILVMYIHYYSCKNQSKSTPAADGSDGLETVRAILGSSIVSCLTTAYRYITKEAQNDHEATTAYANYYCSIIFYNVVIITLALLLWDVGLC